MAENILGIILGIGLCLWGKFAVHYVSWLVYLVGGVIIVYNVEPLLNWLKKRNKKN